MSVRDDALWDPTIDGADSELQRLQQQLAPFGLKARGLGEWQPRPVRRARPRRWPRFVAAGLAASLLLFGLHSYRLSWQAGAAWRVHGSATAELRPGEWLQSDAERAIDIDVARIGRVTLSPDSKLQLVETRSGRHRLRLASGHLRARIWAPPGQFGVESGRVEVVDMGCDFDVWKQTDERGRVYVRSGWVEYRFGTRDVLLPSGYQLTFDGARPSVPLRPDASPEFMASVLKLQQRLDANEAISALSTETDRAAALSRPQDSYTLLYLLSQRHALAETALYPRLAESLGVDADDAAHRAAWARGDIAAVNRWWNAYPTQPKRWWANWADVLR